MPAYHIVNLEQMVLPESGKPEGLKLGKGDITDGGMQQLFCRLRFRWRHPPWRQNRASTVPSAL